MTTDNIPRIVNSIETGFPSLIISGKHYPCTRDGWIAHDGNGVPDFGGCKSIDVRLRRGTKADEFQAHIASSALRWDHIGSNGDITHWRPYGVGEDCSGAQEQPSGSAHAGSAASDPAAPIWSDWIPHKAGDPCPADFTLPGAIGVSKLTEPYSRKPRAPLVRPKACYQHSNPNAAMLARDERPETERERAYRRKLDAAFLQHFHDEEDALYGARSNALGPKSGLTTVAPLAGIGGLWPTE